jgi:hypothetical protein
MGLRKRSYLAEMTTSGAVPAVVRPFALVRKAFPAVLSGLQDVLTRRKKRKKRLLKRFSKMGPPLPPRI